MPIGVDDAAGMPETGADAGRADAGEATATPGDPIGAAGCARSGIQDFGGARDGDPAFAWRARSAFWGPAFIAAIHGSSSGSIASDGKWHLAEAEGAGAAWKTLHPSMEAGAGVPGIGCLGWSKGAPQMPEASGTYCVAVGVKGNTCGLDGATGAPAAFCCNSRSAG